jgi:hypothetical protein
MKNHKSISDSKSLWNYTLSPGWTNEEVDVLKIALMKFGIGKWKRIKKSNCLPSKTIAQMNLQTQRLIGQQSLAEFMGLHVDLQKIFQDNKQKIVKNIYITLGAFYYSQKQLHYKHRRQPDFRPKKNKD